MDLALAPLHLDGALVPLLLGAAFGATLERSGFVKRVGVRTLSEPPPSIPPRPGSAVDIASELDEARGIRRRAIAWMGLGAALLKVVPCLNVRRRRVDSFVGGLGAEVGDFEAEPEKTPRSSEAAMGRSR